MSGRGGHPPGLRGREIGMYYAARSKAQGGPRVSAEERLLKKIARGVGDDRPEELNIPDKLQGEVRAALHKLDQTRSCRSLRSTPRFKRGRLPQGGRAVLANVDNSENAGDESTASLSSTLDVKNSKLPAGGPLAHQRMRLPSWKKREEIVKMVSENQVLVISGETGCGKTTQVPQYILDAFDSVQGANLNMICTQPRRISAVSVAERVAAERGEALGQTAGYQIRFESESSRSTRLLFCTTGILLRRVQGDPHLDGVSHIVVDEVHERSIDTDFLLIILRDLMASRPDLRIVLMSATLNSQMFSDYFGGCPVVHIEGFTHPVTEYFLEDALEATGYVPNPPGEPADGRARGSGRPSRSRGRGAGGPRQRDLRRRLRDRDEEQEVEDLRKKLAGTNFSDRTLLSTATLMKYGDGTVPLDLVVRVLEHIDGLGEGAVLVFVPGWDEISKLHDLLMTHPRFSNQSSFRVLPLHSSIPTASQREIFDRPPKGVRKIVLSTNIAETSITIDDVVFVLDSGRFKEKTYDPVTNVSCLESAWVSKASSRQRRGRAGRVQAGVCYHLFSRAAYEDFIEYQEPEMLRTPLESLCLQVKAMGVEDAGAFLGRALQAPPQKSIENATELLRLIGALDRHREVLTPLGEHLAMLPVDPRLGKMLLYAVMLQCLDPILTIAASLGFRNPFTLALLEKSAADRAKLEFAASRVSDHDAFLAAYNGWRAAGYRGPQFARRNFLSHTTLGMIDEMRMQFVQLLSDAGFLTMRAASARAGPRAPKYSPELDNNSHNGALVKGVLVAGLFPSLCRVDFRTKRVVLFTRSDGKVKPHPGSVANLLHQQHTHRWLVYYEKVRSTGLYLLDVSEVSPLAVCLFGGPIDIDPTSRRLLVATGDAALGNTSKLPENVARKPWVTFADPNNVAPLIQDVRRALDGKIEQKLIDPHGFDLYSEEGGGSTLAEIVSRLLAHSEGVPYHDIPWLNAGGDGAYGVDFDMDSDDPDEEYGARNREYGERAPLRDSGGPYFRGGGRTRPYRARGSYRGRGERSGYRGRGRTGGRGSFSQ